MLILPSSKPAKFLTVTPISSPSLAPAGNVNVRLYFICKRLSLTGVISTLSTPKVTFASEPMLKSVPPELTILAYTGGQKLDTLIPAVKSAKALPRTALFILFIKTILSKKYYF